MKSTIIALLAVGGIWAGEGWGQVEVEWERTYSTDLGLFCSDVIQLTNGDFIVCGSNTIESEDENWSHGDFFLMRVNGDGDSLWSVTFGSVANEALRCVRNTSDECLIAVGFTQDSASFGCLIAKFDLEGQVVWSFTYPGLNPQEIIETSDGGFAVVGEAGNWIRGGTDAVLLKFSADGDSLWTKSYEGQRTTAGHAIVQSEDGGYYVAGGIYPSQGGHWDGLLIRTDSEGRTIWLKTYGMEFKEIFNSICRVPDGSYLLGGNITDFTQRPFLEYYWATKVDANGDSIWSKFYGDTCDKYCYSLISTNQRGFALSGYVSTDFHDQFGRPTYDFLMMRFDERGELIWQKAFGGDGNQQAYAAIQTSDGRFLLAGYGDEGITLIKTTNDAIPPLTILLNEPLNGDTLSEYQTVFGWECYPDTVRERVLSYSLNFLCGENTLSISSEYVEIAADFYDVIGRRDEWERVEWWVEAITESDTISSIRHSYFWMEPTESVTNDLVIPSRLSLSAYPNPFNSSTTISFTTGPINREATRLSVHDISGREVADLTGGLASGPYAAGEQSVRWDASGLSAGVYLVRLAAGEKTLTRKIVLIK